MPALAGIFFVDNNEQAVKIGSVYNKRQFFRPEVKCIDINVGTRCELYSVFNPGMDANRFVSSAYSRL